MTGMGQILSLPGTGPGSRYRWYQSVSNPLFAHLVEHRRAEGRIRQDHVAELG